MTETKKKLRLAGIELGGMSVLVSIAEDHPTNIIKTHKVLNYDDPNQTLPQVVAWVKEQKVDAIGIGSFGPVDLNPHSKTYGYITSTPKKGWKYTDVLSPFKKLGVPVGISTDVNVAAVGELAYGNHGDINSCCYITVGTGIGVGVVVDGKPVTGLLHPEGGHFKPPRYSGDDIKGNCPFHSDCTEGLANAAAVAERAKCDIRKLETISDDHPVWEMEAFYLAHLCSVLTTVVSPQVIVLGGGVLRRTLLFPKIRKYYKELLNKYLVHTKLDTEIDSYIVPSRFNIGDTTSGSVGCLEIGLQAYQGATKSKL